MTYYCIFDKNIDLVKTINYLFDKLGYKLDYTDQYNSMCLRVNVKRKDFGYSQGGNAFLHHNDGSDIINNCTFDKIVEIIK